MKSNVLMQKVLGGFIFLGLIFVAIALYDFKLFLLIVNFLWLSLFFLTLLFIVLGILTFLGRKDEASRIIDMFLEGSLTVIDIGNFLKGLAITFLEVLSEFIRTLIPYLSYLLAIIIYFGTLLGFKYIGANYDVTFVTIALAFFMTVFAGLLTLPKKETFPAKEKTYTEELSPSDWNKPDRYHKFQDAFVDFKARFVDAFEVVILILFLTIDSTKLFFLPERFNVHISAKIYDYDLMVRGINITDHAGITFQLIMIGVAIELVRQIIRVIAVGMNFYRNPYKMPNIDEYDLRKKEDKLKATIRNTVYVSKDDFLMFAAFTVFITFVFLLFPRLKLVALITASGAGLLLDLVFRKRLTYQEKEDLLSRTFRNIVGNRIEKFEKQREMQNGTHSHRDVIKNKEAKDLETETESDQVRDLKKTDEIPSNEDYEVIVEEDFTEQEFEIYFER